MKQAQERTETPLVKRLTIPSALHISLPVIATNRGPQITTVVSVHCFDYIFAMLIVTILNDQHSAGTDQLEQNLVLGVLEYANYLVDVSLFREQGFLNSVIEILPVDQTFC